MRDWNAAPLGDSCAHIVERYDAAIRAELPRLEGLLRAARMVTRLENEVLLPRARRLAFR